MISIEEFKNIELRVAKIVSAERIEGSDKLLKLRVSLGDVERQILSGIAKAYNPEELIGRDVVIVANLEPRVFTLRYGSGQIELESQGMLLAAADESGEPVLLILDREVSPGSGIK